MTREDWRKVGEALLVGRRLHKSNNAFGVWVTTNGFGDIARETRAGAMWLAENWTVVDAVYNSNPDLCHPHHIRAAYNKAKRTPAPPTSTTTPATTVTTVEPTKATL